MEATDESGLTSLQMIQEQGHSQIVDYRVKQRGNADDAVATLLLNRNESAIQ